MPLGTNLLFILLQLDVFSRKLYADIVVDSLKFCQKNKGLRIHAWCIMTNHIHLIISTAEPYKLSDALRNFKKFTSTQITDEIQNNCKESRRNWMLWIFKKAGEKNNRNKEIQFWQQDNHPVECDTNNILETRLNYLHENPIRSGLVRCAEAWFYSSAIDYYTEEKGLIDIDFV